MVLGVLTGVLRALGVGDSHHEPPVATAPSFAFRGVTHGVRDAGTGAPCFPQGFGV